MSAVQTENLNVVAFDHMPSPEEIKARVPLTDRAAEVVVAGRRALMDILDRKDPRLFLVVGPCSIHDPVAGLDYAGRLKALSEEVADVLLPVMRVYFEKPRTNVGWKGLINDPFMDGSCNIQEGLRHARKLLLDIAEMGLPVANEILEPIIPQYI
ncbi:MAG: 3-deoxy-7-phosphoheptulonate synthase, partial [Gammaproteobacteria bacterium]